MKVTIKQIMQFNVMCQLGNLGMFSVESSWEGMVKLRNEKNETMVIHCRESFVENLFNFQGRFDEKESEDFEVVKASPSLALLMNELDKKSE